MNTIKGYCRTRHADGMLMCSTSMYTFTKFEPKIQEKNEISVNRISIPSIWPVFQCKDKNRNPRNQKRTEERESEKENKKRTMKVHNRDWHQLKY